MLVAGYRTTTMFLGNSLLLLLSTPSRYAMLRDERHRLPGAVEELLRFTCPVDFATDRFARENVNMGGVTIPRGEYVERLEVACEQSARLSE